MEQIQVQWTAMPWLQCVMWSCGPAECVLIIVLVGTGARGVLCGDVTRLAPVYIGMCKMTLD